jgi:hypothetical protein
VLCVEQFPVSFSYLIILSHNVKLKAYFPGNLRIMGMIMTCVMLMGRKLIAFRLAGFTV